MSYTSLKTYLPDLRLLSVPAACFGFLAVQPIAVQAGPLTVDSVEVSEGEEGIDLMDPALLRNYEGMLLSTDMVPAGIVAARVSRRGRTTLRFTGAGLRATGRATIDESGLGTGSVRLGRTYLPLTFQVTEGGSEGTFELTGEIKDGTGATFIAFTAKPPAYGRRETPVEVGGYTIAMLGATMPAGDVPDGDGSGTTKVGRGGSVRFSGYNADGSRFSTRATILEGGTMIFYTRLARSGMAVGELTFQDIANMSDFDGDVYYTREFTGRGAYPGSYSFTANALGNRWYQGVDVRTAMGLDKGSNNAVLRFTGGTLDGLDVIATIDIRGRITIPRTQSTRLSGSVNLRDGSVRGRVQNYDPASGYVVRSNGAYYAAVLPKMVPAETPGSYATQNGAGALEIVANTAGDLPPITSINPRVNAVSYLGGGYRVQVTASEPWTAVVPEEYETWVSVTPESGQVDETTGNADALVTVLVSRAISLQDRDAFLRIAGQNHSIVQEGTNTAENFVAINPEQMTIGILGGSYVVTISASNPGNIPANAFFSPVDWVTVTPFTNPITGILDRANVTVAPPDGGVGVEDPSRILRSAEILIAGVRHTVDQVFSTDPGNPDPDPVPASAP